MISKTYGELRKALTAEGAFRVSNVYGALTLLIESTVFGLGCALLITSPRFGPGSNARRAANP